MAKKTQSAHEDHWIKSIPLLGLQTLITQAQQHYLQLSQRPNIEAQMEDVALNFQLLNESPLLRIQTLRLLKEQDNQFEAFKDLWFEQLRIEPQRQLQLDKNFLSPKFANADLTRYRQYILSLVYILLQLNDKTMNIPTFMPLYVQWMNGIQQAYTTSKVTLRVEPNVKSDIVFELPKHAQVEVCEAPSPYWKKIRVTQENQELFGFVMSAYLKF